MIGLIGKEREMERLTTRINGYAYGKRGRSADKLDGTYHRGSFECTAIVERLAYYEDLKGSGRLLELPCAVGEIVYGITWQRDNFHKRPYQVVSRSSFSLDMLDNMNKTVFLTREAAEEALERMVDGNGQ